MNQSKFYLLEKLANQSIFNGAFMIEMIYNSFNESIVTRNGKIAWKRGANWLFYAFKPSYTITHSSLPGIKM